MRSFSCFSSDKVAPCVQRNLLEKVIQIMLAQKTVQATKAATTNRSADAEQERIDLVLTALHVVQALISSDERMMSSFLAMLSPPENGLAGDVAPTVVRGDDVVGMLVQEGSRHARQTLLGVLEAVCADSAKALMSLWYVGM